MSEPEPPEDDEPDVDELEAVQVGRQVETIRDLVRRLEGTKQEFPVLRGTYIDRACYIERFLDRIIEDQLRIPEDRWGAFEAAFLDKATMGTKVTAVRQLLRDAGRLDEFQAQLADLDRVVEERNWMAHGDLNMGADDINVDLVLRRGTRERPHDREALLAALAHAARVGKDVGIMFIGLHR